MEASRKRHLKSGNEFSHLFPPADTATTTVRKNADLNDTVLFIPKVVHQTLSHTKKIASLLQTDSLYETCRKTWHFVYEHINYKKDQEGFEQIRSPARSWHDRSSGVDCDCYSVFISSILTNLGIQHTLRITKYRRNYFQHIYPIVPLPDGNYLTLDCVTDFFNHEVPFSAKKDFQMDLQYLSGLDDTPSLYADANDTYYMNGGMEELGKIIQRKLSQGKKLPAGIPKAAAKSKTILKNKLQQKKAAKAAAPNTPKQKKPRKFLNIINKVNPATVLLRNGILASMKLNVKNVAGRLRWSYLSAQQAAQKGIFPEKFQKLVATRQKLENIFFKAGGKPDNLRKAILQGKGNKDKAIHGLDGFDGMIGYADEFSSLGDVLGAAMYYEENIEGMEGYDGFGELGEPITLTSIAAASGVVAGIVAALKQIGDIFQKKSKETQDFDEARNEQAENEAPVTDTPASAPVVSTPGNVKNENSFAPGSDSSSSSESNMVKKANDEFSPPSNVKKDTETGDEQPPNNTANEKENADSNTGNSAAPDNGGTPDKESFWDKNKNWIKPVAIGAGGITLLAIGYQLLRSTKAKNKSSPAGAALSGVPKRKRKNHHRQQKRKTTKKAVALL
ncbi:MAG TPA: hypothetical protein PKA77_14185 [Chitinophagaceae bacterium]|jgi:hypothetical protein|nr:hypothetical protein [Chitinophagaceae bacterium]HMU58639.1 hypothetical protein [Chitinophagaceae bacterium]